MSVKERLIEMGMPLPVAPKPVAAYVAAVKAGQWVYVSGQLPFVEGKLTVTGRLGAGVSIEDAKQAARIAALNGLAAASSVVDLDDVIQVVKVTGFVASAPDFYDHPQVVNGASEFLTEVFGDAGRHARAAVGLASLPLNTPVEVEMILFVKE